MSPGRRTSARAGITGPGHTWEHAYHPRYRNIRPDHVTRPRDTVNRQGSRPASRPRRAPDLVHHDTPAYPSAILCALEYDSWEGGVTASNDPSGDVLEARFFPIDEALRVMAETTGLPHHQPVVEYLLGRAPAGTTWMYRRTDGGTDELVAHFAPSVP
ncbi:hypothetical protein [Kitasatospora sp. NPDC059327]|uniref:hypothetical protein n=1 Tax=Kitasatospora sp. NPDC059327 TaxID=3346803 RepID=UPI0036B41072